MASDRQLIRATGVTVRYGQGPATVVALDGVDFAIDDGERAALWGPSGSGKTTLLHTLAGLTKPTSGTVDLRAGAEPAFVFQGANLLPTFTALENVAFAAAVVGAAADRDPLAPQDLLEIVGLGAKGDSLPAELSGGEAQRVAIARALAQRPALVLCDEPTGHLDSDTGRRVLDVVDALQERLGFALVTATHDAEVASRFARRIEMADGRVRAGEPVAVP
jgi:putative ABC transport system ATP-binding protein